jgi:hypothetical protein
VVRQRPRHIADDQSQARALRAHAEQGAPLRDSRVAAAAAAAEITIYRRKHAISVADANNLIPTAHMYVVFVTLYSICQNLFKLETKIKRKILSVVHQ